MKKSRRKFLKVAGISALGIGMAPAITTFASSKPQGAVDAIKSKNAEVFSAKRWGMVIDTSKLTDEIATNIADACHKAHNVPDFDHEPDKEKFPKTSPINHHQEVKWIWKEHFEHAFPDKEMNF